MKSITRIISFRVNYITNLNLSSQGHCRSLRPSFKLGSPLSFFSPHHSYHTIYTRRQHPIFFNIQPHQKYSKDQKSSGSRKGKNCLIFLVSFCVLYFSIRKLSEIFHAVRRKRQRKQILKLLLEANSKVDGFFFDFDDTLVDSDHKRGKHTYKLATTLAPEGKKLRLRNMLNVAKVYKHGKTDEGSVRLYYKLYKKNIVENFGYSEEETFEEFRKMWLDFHIKEVLFFPLVPEILMEMKKRHTESKFCLVTNSRKELVENTNTTQFPKFLSFFDFYLTSVDYKGFPKPDPYPYILAQEKIGSTNPKKCIVFEDTSTGVNAGKKAGCVVVGILGPYNSKRKLRKADLIISWKELKKLLDRS